MINSSYNVLHSYVLAAAWSPWHVMQSHNWSNAISTALHLTEGAVWHKCHEVTLFVIDSRRLGNDAEAWKLLLWLGICFKGMFWPHVRSQTWQLIFRDFVGLKICSSMHLYIFFFKLLHPHGNLFTYCFIEFSPSACGFTEISCWVWVAP